MPNLKKYLVTVSILFAFAAPSMAQQAVMDFVDDCVYIAQNCAEEDVIVVITPVDDKGDPVDPAVDDNGDALYTFVVAFDGNPGNVANTNPSGQSVAVDEGHSTLTDSTIIITQEGAEGQGSMFITAPSEVLTDPMNTEDRIVEVDFEVDQTVAGGGNCGGNPTELCL